MLETGASGASQSQFPTQSARNPQKFLRAATRRKGNSGQFPITASFSAPILHVHSAEFPKAGFYCKTNTLTVGPAGQGKVSEEPSTTARGGDKENNRLAAGAQVARRWPM